MGKARAMEARQGSGRVPHKPLIDLSRASLLCYSATESIHYRTNQRLFGVHLSETDAETSSGFYYKLLTFFVRFVK